MSSVQHLREFISERLTAAAAQIFSEFEKTIEEELEAQRRLLDISWKRTLTAEAETRTAIIRDHKSSPAGTGGAEPNFPLFFKSNGDRDAVIEPPQHRVSEELLLAEPTAVVQESRSGRIEEEPEPSGLKPGRQEACSRPQEQLVTFILTSVQKEHDYSEPGARSPPQTRPAAQNRAEHPETSRRGGDTCSSSSTGRRSMECDVCGKLFRYRCMLKEHYRVHTGERPYACSTCGKTFSHRCRLITHRKIHTGEKPYLCNTCGRRFTDPSTLRKHAVTHTGERPYSCQTCGKTFSLNSSLSVHLRTHLGETPFVCNTCGKSFTYKATLKRHARIHSGETPFSCDVCGKRFKHDSSLNVHLSSHTGEKTRSHRDKESTS